MSDFEKCNFQTNLNFLLIIFIITWYQHTHKMIQTKLKYRCYMLTILIWRLIFGFHNSQ